jgi:peptidoglycan/LPS O-acetylase OafA/YrhL
MALGSSLPVTDADGASGHGVAAPSAVTTEATQQVPTVATRSSPDVSPTRLVHLRALDGLRGVAVLAVVVFHFAPDVAPGGFLGVDLFFVLSGFLITSLLVKEWDTTQRIALSSFWVRRARRLLPALLLLLGVVAVYSLIFPDPVDAHRFGLDGLSSLFYVANWHFVDTGQRYIDQFLNLATSPLRHMWSLAIEEQFYLVWPLLVVGIAKLIGYREGPRRSTRRAFKRALLVACIVLGALSFVRMVTLFTSGRDVNRAYYGTDSRAFIIMSGAVLAVLTFGTPSVPRALRRGIVIAGCFGAVALVVAMASLTVDSSWLYEGGYGLVTIAMALVLLAAAQPGVNPLAHVLGFRALVGLGLISYGVYLWHWPVSLWITEGNTGITEPWLFLARASVTLAVSLASYFLLEMPIRTGRLRIGFSRGTIVSAAVATAFLVPALTFPSVFPLPTTSARASEAFDTTQRYAAAARCDGSPASRPIDADRKPLIQFEGNSLAGEMRECLGEIMTQRGVEIESAGTTGVLCEDLPRIRGQVRATRPDAGILFALVGYSDHCGQPWQTAVDQLVSMWKHAGMHVYLTPSPRIVKYGREQANRRIHRIEAAYYATLAAHDPDNITVLDSGTFVRTDNGKYVFRMPCLPDGEPGCNANDTVGVRFTDGFHFCTNPEFAGEGCLLDEQKGGQRRGAASIAAGLIPSLEALTSRDTKHAGNN